MKKAVLFLSLIVLLSGCATTSMIKSTNTPALTTSQDQAKLVIIRETWFGGGIVFWNYLDGKMIGETMGNTFFVTSVEPGPHYVVVATENSSVAHINFKPGITYFLGEGVTMGVWRARTSGFYPMTKADAMKAIQSCSFLEIDPRKTMDDMDPKLYREAIDAYENDVKENPDAYKDILNYNGVKMN